MSVYEPCKRRVLPVPDHRQQRRQTKRRLRGVAERLRMKGSLA